VEKGRVKNSSLYEEVMDMRISDIINEQTIEIFNHMQELDTKEEMIEYLRSLPRREEDI
jgi:hypothetical protein